MRRGRAAALVVVAAALPPAAASETVTYSYDTLGRVSRVSSSGGPNNGKDIATRYDAAGNRCGYAFGTSGVSAPLCGSTTGMQQLGADPDSLAGGEASDIQAPGTDGGMGDPAPTEVPEPEAPEAEAPDTGAADAEATDDGVGAEDVPLGEAPGSPPADEGEPAGEAPDAELADGGGEPEDIPSAETPEAEAASGEATAEAAAPELTGGDR